MADETMFDLKMRSRTWQNWHETVEAPIKGVATIWYPDDAPTYGADAINRCTRAIQRAIAEAQRRNVPCRAVGSTWSLSLVPATDGILIDTSRLKGLKPVRPSQIDPAYPGGVDAAAGLWLLQSGATVAELNTMLESDRYGRSLRTSGAANGQSFVGAAAAGTHGSALGVGALHDHIVAIHLLAGPTKQVWLERASRPVLKAAFPASLGAEVIRDDALFNAVVVGLGAFGVVHNVVIETRPRFLLAARSFARDAAGALLTLDAAMRRVIATLDFDSHPMLKPAAGDPQPYFFQPIIDPNTNPVQVLVTQMFERPWRAGYVPSYALNQASFGPGYDFISLLGRLLDIFQPAVPLVSQIAKGQLFDLSARTGSWGEMFGFKTPRTKVASGSVAVGIGDALKTIDLLIALNAEIGPAPLVFGCRYVKKSPALLAMNRFDTSFVVSIDGIFNAASNRFFAAIPARMEAAGIPFTQHWGKTNGYTPARTAAAFGGDLAAWIAARHRLLPDPVDRVTFTNAYMRERGLDA